jgi:hypothetical protein
MYGAGSLALRRRRALHLFFSFVGMAMPEGEGSLFDDLDAALQSGFIGNAGAEFSENGFASLLKAAETDDKVAEKTGSRPDRPARSSPGAFVTNNRRGSIPRNYRNRTPSDRFDFGRSVR